MDTGTLAVIGLSVVLVVWYGIGHLYNRRRGRQLFRWLEAGLDVLGGQTEAGWIGSPASGARINVVHASPPFRRLEITLLLENRENPLLWLLGYLRGKRDWLIIKATLRSPGHGRVWVISSGEAPGLPERSWTWQEGSHGLTVGYEGRDAQRRASALQPWLEVYGSHVDRFFWRKSDPHIILQARVGRLLKVPARAFLRDLTVALKTNEKT
mgnify:CR=1 FL=1